MNRGKVKYIQTDEKPIRGISSNFLFTSKESAEEMKHLQKLFDAVTVVNNELYGTWDLVKKDSPDDVRSSYDRLLNSWDKLLGVVFNAEIPE